MSSQNNIKMGFRLDKRWVSRSFGKAALNYDELAVLQRKIGNKLLSELDNISLDSLTILDVGAGTGFLMNKLIERNATVLALDIAPEMLTLARKASFNAGNYICGDAELLPVKDATIDIVFSNFALQWCTNIDAVFTGFKRVLKPGGLILFSSFGPKTLQELRAAWEQIDDYSHVNSFLSKSNLNLGMISAGLSGGTIQSELLTICYPSVLDLMRELKGIGANNMTENRPRSLMGKNKFNRMTAAYEKLMSDKSVYTSFEILLGKAYAG